MVEKRLTKDSDIILFSPESKMEWIPWLRYFKVICIEENNDDVWIIGHTKIS